PRARAAFGRPTRGGRGRSAWCAPPAARRPTSGATPISTFRGRCGLGTGWTIGSRRGRSWCVTADTVRPITTCEPAPRAERYHFLPPAQPLNGGFEVVGAAPPQQILEGLDVFQADTAGELAEGRRRLHGRFGGNRPFWGRRLFDR